MKHIVSHFRTKHIAAVAMLLLIALFVPLMTPAVSATTQAVYSWSDKGVISEPTPNLHLELGDWEDSVSYDTSSKKLSWTSSAIATFKMYHIPSNINYGEAKYTLFRYNKNNETYYKVKEDFSYTVASDDGNYKYYTITGDALYKQFIPTSGADPKEEYIGKLVFRQELRSRLSYIGTSTETIYFKFGIGGTSIVFLNTNPAPAAAK